MSDQIASSISKAVGRTPSLFVSLIARFCRTFDQLAAAIRPITNKPVVNNCDAFNVAGFVRNRGARVTFYCIRFLTKPATFAREKLRSVLYIRAARQ